MDRSGVQRPAKGSIGEVAGAQAEEIIQRLACLSEARRVAEVDRVVAGVAVLVRAVRKTGGVFAEIMSV